MEFIGSGAVHRVLCFLTWWRRNEGKRFLCVNHPSRNMLMSYSSSSCEQNLTLRSSQWPSSQTVMSSVQCRLQSHLYSYAATSLPSSFHMVTQSSSTSPHQFSSAQSLVMVEILWEKDNMSETMSIRKIRIIIMFLWRDSFTHRWQQRNKPDDVYMFVLSGPTVCSRIDQHLQLWPP